MAGIYLYIQLFSCLAISMYTLSFADYFLSLFPGVNAKLICTFVIIASTATVVLVYAVMSTVVAGVLPVEQVANHPLSVSAVAFMPKNVFTFFVVGGAMFVLYLIGLDLNTVANSTVILFTIIRGVIAYSVLQFPKKMPELWAKSAFHVSNGKLKVICDLSIALATLSVAVLLVSTSLPQIIGNTVILVISVVLAFLLNKRVILKPSYTEK